MKKYIVVILLLLPLFAVEAKGIRDEVRNPDDLYQQRAEQILEQARTLRTEAKYSDSIALVLENENLFIQAGQAHYAMALNMLGILHSDLGDYAKAEPYYLEALAVREAVYGREHPDYAGSLNNLGAFYFDLGDYAKAEAYYLEAKAVREAIYGREHPDYARSLNNLGNLHNVLGDYARSEAYYLEAKAVYETVYGREHPLYAGTVNNMGALYRAHGDYAQAEACHLEAKAVREAIYGREHPLYASSLNNLGNLYCDLGDYVQAEAYYLEAKAVRESVYGREHPLYADTVENLGILYREIGDYAQAEEYHLEAKAVYETVYGREHPDYARSLNNLGVLYSEIGDYAKAEAHHLEAKAVYEQLDGREHPDYARSLYNLGTLYRALEDYAQAEAYHLEAKAVFELAYGKEHPDYAASLNDLGNLYRDLGDYAQAEAYIKELSELSINQVSRNFSFMSERQRSLYFNTMSKYFERSYSLSRIYPVATVNGLNYNNTLFTKGLLLRTTNAVREAVYSSGDQTLIEQFEELGRKRQQIGTLRQNGGDEAWIQKLETEAEVLDKILTQASAAFREFQADLIIDWQNVKDSLQPNEAAIEFVSFRIYDKGRTDGAKYAALVLRRGMEAPAWVPLCEETVLDDIFRELGGKSPREQASILYDTKGRDLYAAVWQPLENLLEGVNVIYYSPSGLLHKVSFSAIPAGDLRLTDKYELNLVSSTREVIHLKNKTAELAFFGPGVAAGSRSAVVYGGLRYDIDEGTMRDEALAYNLPETETRISAALPTDLSRGGRGGWGYLAGTERERLAVQGMLAANGVPHVIYSGAGGNEESFKALSGGRVSVIHLATHGFFIEDIEKSDDERELLLRVGGGRKALENPLLRSGLILAGGNRAWANDPVAGVEDGILFADEVARMNLLGAELVVLSACETGLGDLNNSEGVFGLQRAFKLAGAETIVMSLWEVDDRATVMLMERFYRNWLSGKSKQEAMKDAQRSLRAEGRFASPYFWAAFVLMD